MNDLDSVTEFYSGVVGLDVLERTDTHASLGVEESLLEILHDPDAQPRGRREAGLFHTAFRVPSRQALGDALHRAEDWGLDGASDHLVSEALYLRDPEGNGVEIYRDRPREEWSMEGGEVRMPSLPLDLDDVREEAVGREDAPEGTDVGHVHLETTSLPQATEFYRDGLGLNVRNRYGESAVFLAVGDYHHHVGLNTWNGRSAPAGRHRGLAWWEVLVPDEATLEAAADRLEAAGHAVEDRPGGLVVADPDAIRLHLAVDRD